MINKSSEVNKTQNSLLTSLRNIQNIADISLPAVIIIGYTNAGKRSILEQMVGIDFMPK